MTSKHIESDTTVLHLQAQGQDDSVRIPFRPSPCKVADMEIETFAPKFTENPHAVEHEDEYPRTGSDPGLVVIFNQQTFGDDDEMARRGTNRDVNELILTFGRLGYNIEERYIYNNLKRFEILEAIKELSSTDHSDRNCLIIIVLTHGEVNNVLQVEDGLMETSEFWTPFSNTSCLSFSSKPKFFVFQACKGNQNSRSGELTVPVIPAGTYRTPLETDFLIAFAAVEGTRSYRHTLLGSWFIQELCRNFNAHGRRDDVISLLLRITKCVAYNHYHVAKDNGRKVIVKQMPLLLSTLTKKFYLCKSKDRNLLLQLKKKQEEMLELLAEALKST
ncbi:hypothetical protein PPYR_13951 [Photinus pyralis]|uniref:Caspase family p20 domain-containing protein n=1 Tax=Photinus pyralis TaxID=7054 RepID=A0A1Y1N7Q0_PHOPY|nr:caspase-1-like [Photinus pyralis]KAB0791990.1 hypothetical protein PPYR_13951 [Photinus pyralis]